jgi:hypothetical protein
MAEEQDDERCVIEGKLKALSETVGVLVDFQKKRQEELPRVFASAPRIDSLKRELRSLARKEEPVPCEYKRFLLSSSFYYGVQPSCLSDKNIELLKGGLDDYNVNLQNAAKCPKGSSSFDRATCHLVSRIAKTRQAISRCDSQLGLVNASPRYSDRREELLGLDLIATERKLHSFRLRNHEVSLNGKAIWKIMQKRKSTGRCTYRGPYDILIVV